MRISIPEFDFCPFLHFSKTILSILGVKLISENWIFQSICCSLRTSFFS